MTTLIGIFLASAIGILPMVVYSLFLWWFDRYEKEPLGLLVAAFLWGAVPSIIFSLIVELVLDVPIAYFVDPAVASAVGAIAVAPVVEEIFKGVAMVLLLLFFRREIDSPLDGIIYGGLVGFGFAAVENVFYLAGALIEAGPADFAFLTVLRTFIFGLNHALFTGLTGLGLALARTSSRGLVKIGAPIVGLLSGIMSHGIHNASVTLAAELVWPCLVALVSSWGGVSILLIVILWTSTRERRWIATFLVNEIEKGTLSKDDYAIICSYFRRVGERTEALLSGNFQRWWNLGRYYRLATELAFNKRRLTLFPEEKDTSARIQELRQQVINLRGQC